MLACSFDMMFTYVCTGWEGTSNDSRVLMDAITREENRFPMPKEVLKNRFPILKLMPNYPIRKQKRIFVACCAVHNFIRMQLRNDTLFQQFEDNDVDVVDEKSSGANQEGENMH
ncbi:hypothetical protein DVH24_000217 [Malus domestica]|uniref:DDE Tnp4 domain-containing protein n=1 Tax=Malus domestica TaxID=3750 RepID=A0A498IZB8_MALDO|nr:hypothetical protein DVH24_000217 [Malus domestica]